jgi:hypothetical protein
MNTAHPQQQNNVPEANMSDQLKIAGRGSPGQSADGTQNSLRLIQSLLHHIYPQVL